MTCTQDIRQYLSMTLEKGVQIFEGMRIATNISLAKCLNIEWPLCLKITSCVYLYFHQC